MRPSMVFQIRSRISAILFPDTFPQYPILKVDYVQFAASHNSLHAPITKLDLLVCLLVFFTAEQIPWLRMFYQAMKGNIVANL